MQSFSLRRASREQAPLCIIASSAQEGAHLTAAPGTSDALTCPGSSLEDAPCAVVQEAASSLIWWRLSWWAALLPAHLWSALLHVSPIFLRADIVVCCSVWKPVFIGCGSQSVWRSHGDLNGRKIHSLLCWRRTEPSSHHQITKLPAPPPSLLIKRTNSMGTHVRPASPLVPWSCPSSSAHKCGSVAVPSPPCIFIFGPSLSHSVLKPKTLRYPFFKLQYSQLMTLWESGSNDRLYFLGLQNHCKWWLQSWN